MSDFLKLTKDETINFLAENKNTLIIFHARPDADAVGASFALKLLFEKMGIKAYCICANEIPERLQFLTKGLQDSILFESIPKGFNAERVISVDTASPSQLGELENIYLPGKIDLMIDHHEKGSPYANSYSLPKASASGEIIFELAEELENRGLIDKIDLKIAELLYVAISADTGCFKYSNVTENTFKVGAKLVKIGIDIAKLNYYLFDCKSLKVLKAENEGFKNLKITFNGRVASICFPFKLKKKLKLLDEHLETLVDVARAVEGVEVAFAVRQLTPKKVFRVSMRSSSNINVSDICTHFGGGGHAKASGCTIEAKSIEEAEKMVLNQLEPLLK